MIFLKDKLIVLKDPVLNISKINEIKKIDDFSDKVHEFINRKFFLSIGRFTRQKKLSIDEFMDLSEKSSVKFRLFTTL